jgi:hypothetical protein
MDSRFNAWKTAPSGKWGDVVCWFESLVETGNGIISASESERMVDGVPSWMDRHHALGNAIVPQVAEWLGRRIVAADALTEG